MIFEGIVTTLNTDGTLNVAPMGPEFGDDPSTFLLRPFKSATTYQNLVARGEGVWHATDDVLLIARAAIGLDVNPETRPATEVIGRVIVDCSRFVEFRVIEIDDRGDRASIRVESIAEGHGNRDWRGLNRARNAVVEAAILATRASFLPIDDLRIEFARLAIPIEKTGGDREREAFGLLRDHVREVARIRGESEGSTS